MKYGFVLPHGNARIAADFAHEVEESGWDGFFVWEPVWGVDAWVSLTAAAMTTRHIKLGTMLSAISRMRPWKLASETATLDDLSGGRVILSVGLGAVVSGFKEFGEVTDRRTRAELLDEGLEIITGLWQGQPFSYEGEHYKIEPLDFPHVAPAPVQQPRIPIWVVGAWPSGKSMQRTLRYDGLIPAVMDGTEVRFGAPTPAELEEITAFVKEYRSRRGPFDIVVEGATPGDDLNAAAAMVRPYEVAGATWWLEAMWESQGLQPVLTRIRQGPPRLET